MKLVANQSNPGQLALNSTTIFWEDWDGTSTVLSTGKGGPGVPLALASGPNNIGGLAATATTVYWNTSLNGGQISSVSVASGPVTVVVPNQPGGSDVRCDGAYLVWRANPTIGHGAILRSQLDGSQVATLAQGLGYPVALLATDREVYWGDDGLISNTGVPSNNGSLGGVSLEGGPVDVLESGLLLPQGVAVDNGVVYFTTSQ